MKEGDRNAKFLLTSILTRRRHNNISAIKEGSQWLTSKNEIEQYFVTKSEELFKYEFPWILDDLEGLLHHSITDEINANLMTIPSKEKVRNSVWNYIL